MRKEGDPAGPGFLAGCNARPLAGDHKARAPRPGAVGGQEEGRRGRAPCRRTSAAGGASEGGEQQVVPPGGAQ